jgi:TatD DNase family protein
MIDFHSHLDLYPDPHTVAGECNARGIYVLSVTTTPSAWIQTSALAPQGSRVRTALGLHPQLAHQRKSELRIFDSHLPSAMYVGEIGLDGAPDFKPYWNEQMMVFDHVLRACSQAGGRIMTIHSRRASSAVLDRLEAFPNAGTPILHWFSGSKRDLDKAIALGCWFSVGPAMLAAEKSRTLVRHMPRDRILTETDGPFAQIEGRSAMPWDAQKATIELATLWEMSEFDIEQLLNNNLRRLVGNNYSGGRLGGADYRQLSEAIGKRTESR